METSKKQVKRLASPEALEARVTLFPVGLIAAMKDAVDSSLSGSVGAPPVTPTPTMPPPSTFPPEPGATSRAILALLRNGG